MLKLLIGSLLVITSGLYAQCYNKACAESGYCSEKSDCRTDVPHRNSKGDYNADNSNGDFNYDGKGNQYDRYDYPPHIESCKGNPYDQRGTTRGDKTQQPKGSKGWSDRNKQVLHVCGSNGDRCNPKQPCYNYNENGDVEVVYPEDKEPIDEADIKSRYHGGRGPGR
ncbi:hypothetical protein N9N67_11300 [Bacteriovoracaceae bacterium]|nr:hypothetical protein [Bacteriovoracaceae bacterium]